MGAKTKLNVVYPGVTVRTGDAKTTRFLLGDTHWSDGIHPKYCDGKQTGLVKRLVGVNLALVQFNHSDGCSSMITLPLCTLVRSELASMKPSTFCTDLDLLRESPCVVCNSVGQDGETRPSGFKCRTCIGTSHRWGGIFKKPKKSTAVAV
ncbi:hypothetical protein DIPPA_02353 [Diplonema papillatum]|nr:hypothetical protein DIPPA_02353 [Diplonema papillatum]